MNNEKAKVTNFINIAILDIRNAGDKDFGEVKMVNVGYVLHTPETFDLLKGGKRINVGQYIEADPDARVLLAPTHFTKEYFEQQEQALDLLAFGPITVDWETTPEAIDKGLAKLSVFGGPLMCPRHLIGALQSKIQHQSGETIIFNNPEIRFEMGKLVLDENYLNALKDGSELVVVGKLKIADVLSNELLKSKLKRLYVQGQITCHEENAGVLQTVLTGSHHKIKNIPAGYILVEKALLLNNLALESLQARKIYCTEWVQIDNGVSTEFLDKNLDALIADEFVYCPAGLKDVIVKKCDWLKTSIELYDGELWVIEDKRQLPDFAFNRMEDVATLLVFGELTIDPQVSPEILAKKLDKVHNMGSIHCTPEQIYAIQTLLGRNEGRLVDTTKPKKEKKTSPVENVFEESYVNSNYVRI